MSLPDKYPIFIKIRFVNIDLPVEIDDERLPSDCFSSAVVITSQFD